MRRTLFFAPIAVLFLFAPLSTYAASCPEGYKEYGVWSEDQAKGQIQRIVIAADQCSDEEITALKEGYVCHRITRKCATGDEKIYGCKTGMKTPTVTAKLPADFGGKSIVISKCDKKALSGAIDASFATGNAKPLERLASQLTQTQSGTPVALPASGQVVTGGDIIRRALGEGAPPEVVARATSDAGLQSALALGESSMIARAAQAAGLSAEEAQVLAAERATLRPASALAAPSIVASNGFARPGGVFGSGNSLYASPAELSPYGAASFSYSAANGDSPLNFLSSLFSSGIVQQLLSSLQGSLNARTESTPAPQAASTNTAPEQIATLLVQPSRVKRGESILVSWSALGMKEDACTTTLHVGNTDMVLGTTLEASKRLATNSIVQSEIRIILSCTRGVGQSLMREQLVVIE